MFSHVRKYNIFFVSTAVNYFRCLMNIHLSLFIKSGEHIVAPQRKQMNILLNSMNQTIPRVGSWEDFIFKVARISQVSNAISNKWNFACSDPPFYLIKKLLISKTGFIMQINKLDLNEVQSAGAKLFSYR